MAKRQALNQEFLALYYQADLSEIKRCLTKTANIHKTTATKVTKIVIDATEIKLGLLPYEVILPMISELPIKSIIALCETSRRFAAICDDNRVWKFLLKRDYNITWGKGAKEKYIRLQFIPMISCGSGSTGIITVDRKLYMWGDNRWGQVGIGLYTDIVDQPHPIMEELRWGQVSCSKHTAAITTENKLYMWGNNDYGQLGDDSNWNRNKPTFIMKNITQVSCGDDYTGAVTADGKLYMWGSNYYGRLGDGTIADKNKPILINIKGRVVQVSCGGGHTGAITAEGKLYMWGHNWFGQIGNGTSSSKNSGNKPTLINIKGNPKFVQVSCGGKHTGAITAEGKLYMWGMNKEGQLGIDDETYNTKKPILVDIKARIVQVSCGYYHTGAVTTEGRLYMWGSNYMGVIGDGTYVRKRKPVYIANLDRNFMTQVSCGSLHTGAVTKDGKFYTWGGSRKGFITRKPVIIVLKNETIL